MGRGPKDIHAHLIGDLLVVRLQGVLTAAEQHLVKSLPAEKGRDLLKQVRTHLIETARPLMEAMVQEVTGVKVLSLHHDISTVTGEEVVLFTLAEPPRSAKQEVRRNLRNRDAGKECPRTPFYAQGTSCDETLFKHILDAQCFSPASSSHERRTRGQHSLNSPPLKRRFTRRISGS